jgi:NitT/TauT family transport system ATP-binding protein
MPNDTTVKLECRDVSHAFASSDAWVLRDVALEVKRGEFVALVGASGCGKTSLLRVLAGLIRPERGAVHLGGLELTGIPSKGRAMVFQGDRLFPWRTALRNTLFGLELRSVPRATAMARALAALKLVGLERSVNAYPSELSGGMRQRVNVARALVVEPDFLLMDEPFAALDAQTREIMQQELLRILEQTMVGVVFVTHQIEEALYLADRVVVMGIRPGRIRDEVHVPFPRPRLLEMKRDPRFQDLYARIWKSIESDVLASVLPTRGVSAGNVF